ncbi:MAG: hypothetical protein ACYTG0_43280, partial [Planctomycetota bacterium]
MATAEERYRSLMEFQITDSVSVQDALENIGLLIDLASDLGRLDGTRRGIVLAEECLERQPTAAEAALLHYFSANAWAHVRANSRQNVDADWDWEQPEAENELVHLRRALWTEGYLELPPIRQCQIATNFGNLLSHVGRFVDALEYWARALTIEPHFAMA